MHLSRFFLYIRAVKFETMQNNKMLLSILCMLISYICMANSPVREVKDSSEVSASRVERRKAAARARAASRARTVAREKAEIKALEEIAIDGLERLEADRRAARYAAIEADLEAKAKKKVADSIAAVEMTERIARRQEIDAEYNKKFRNRGLVHSLELSYGYQLSHGDVVYQNLGYREYGSLHPIEIDYTISYRFNNWISLGFGTGVEYTLVNLRRYGDMFSAKYTNLDDYTPLNVPLSIVTKVYLSRGKFQPLLSISGGVWLPDATGLFDLGVGLNCRFSPSGNMYFLISFRTTPYGEFIEESAGSRYNGTWAAYKTGMVWTPSVKVGLAF